MGIYGNVYLYIHIYICTPFFCVWLQKLIYCFIENNSYRPNNSVNTSKTCVVNFFLGMVTTQFNASGSNEIHEATFYQTGYG